MVTIRCNPLEKEAQAAMKKVDYYEFLQISPNADQDTIHRVYRFLAARFHPDNPHSGNAETFSTLTAAYEVLSDEERRGEYDAACARETPERVPLSSKIDFMDNLEGETNRRLAVMALLYFKRRANAQAPEVSLTEIENRMGFPRDYLDFTTWYLQRKGYIVRADNSDFTLTAQGVDFVESQRVNIPVLNKLLTNGAGSQEDSAPEAVSVHATPPPNYAHTLPATTTVRAGIALAEERRLSRRDRRGNQSDRRTHGTDRRG
jgi:curved DNA-binding protein